MARRPCQPSATVWPAPPVPAGTHTERAVDLGVGRFLEAKRGELEPTRDAGLNPRID